MNDKYSGKSCDNNENNLPNGLSRDEYYKIGFSDYEIEFFGLDQPGAPDPHAVGFVVLDLMDEDYEGDID